MQHIEYEEQKKIFQWARLCERQYPMLKFLNSSQNGVRITNIREATRAKASGMKKGYPDIFLPYPYYQEIVVESNDKAKVGLLMSGKKVSMGGETRREIKFCGLFIELKRPKVKGKANPVVSKEQQEWIDYLNSVGYYATVCYGSEEAIELIKRYLVIE